MLRHGLNEAMFLAHRFAQDGNGDAQISFFDKGVVPDRANQFVLLQQAAMVLDQHDQRLEGFGSEGNGAAVP
jgi:hypothetical protein